MSSAIKIRAVLPKLFSKICCNWFPCYKFLETEGKDFKASLGKNLFKSWTCPGLKWNKHYLLFIPYLITCQCDNHMCVHSYISAELYNHNI